MAQLPDFKGSIAAAAEMFNGGVSKKIAESLVFRLDEFESHSKNQDAPSNKANGHVMISYNWQAQPLVKEFVTIMHAHGLPVWVDYEQMHGDTIEVMAAAVEECSVFIMCMSEAYKESGNCRLEANYAFKHRKAIVPLMVENGYTATGWLGILSGNLLYYEMSSSGMVEQVAPKIISEVSSKLGKASLNLLPTHAGLTGSASPPPVSKTTPQVPTATTDSAAAARRVSVPFAPKKVTDMTNAEVAAFIKKQLVETLLFCAKMCANLHPFFNTRNLYC